MNESSENTMYDRLAQDEKFMNIIDRVIEDPGIVETLPVDTFLMVYLYLSEKYRRLTE